MRMNRNQKLTAADIVNNYSQKEIENIISDYGEENWAARIAEFIVRRRKDKKIETTSELVDIIKAAVPKGARRKGGHPARRTFQALRIATNDELDQLKILINKAVKFLNPGGRIVIISFHSLEDRIVKHTFRKLAEDCVCPPDFPICVCDKKSELKIITKSPVQANKSEIEENPRSRSAKLRAGEKI
jgi:16S rRNA (cytosine1402-N4)-methyltransferase